MLPTLFMPLVSSFTPWNQNFSVFREYRKTIVGEASSVHQAWKNVQLWFLVVKYLPQNCISSVLEDKFWQSFLSKSSETRSAKDDMRILRYFIINLKSKTLFLKFGDECYTHSTFRIGGNDFLSYNKITK